MKNILNVFKNMGFWGGVEMKCLESWKKYVIFIFLLSQTINIMALEKEFHWYLNNQNDLVKQYDGRFLVIIDEEVVDNYENFEEALYQSVEKHKVGTFLIQKCTEGEEAYTTTYQRVRFE